MRALFTICIPKVLSLCTLRIINTAKYLILLYSLVRIPTSCLLIKVTSISNSCPVC